MNRLYSFLAVVLLVNPLLSWNQETSSKVRYPLLVHADVPVYPTLAHTARVTGRVEVQVTVKDGTVVATKVMSGSKLLSDATTENIKSWRFWPGPQTTFSTTFVYAIEGRELPETANPKIELQLPTLVKIISRPTKLPATP